jgi:hypothetical protein
MNALNSLVTKIFDWILIPLEWMGHEVALIVISGVFGVLALVVFKHISSQKGIKRAKDKIKGHMIAIRIYQDDLVVVFQSVLRVLTRNLQYVSLNFGPFIPLAIPFVLVAAQMVVRYGFDPIPVVAAEEVTGMLPGKGTELRIEFTPDEKAKASDLTVVLPDGLLGASPLVRNATRGVAFQEIVATRAGVYEIELRFSDGTSYTKAIVAGDEPTPLMQPERVSDFFSAWLWPAEDLFPSDSPIARVQFVYPESDLGWLPMSGPFGVLVMFVVSSMVFAFAAIKPLGVQI